MVYTLISCLREKKKRKKSKENEQSVFKYVYKENFQTRIHREITKFGTHLQKATLFMS